MTVSQCHVSARKRRMWRREAAASRTSQREGAAFAEAAVATVVLAVVPVPGVELPSLVFEPAPTGAVAMPANASSSPQARMERRKSSTS